MIWIIGPPDSTRSIHYGVRTVSMVPASQPDPGGQPNVRITRREGACETRRIRTGIAIRLALGALTAVQEPAMLGILMDRAWIGIIERVPGRFAPGIEW